MTLFRSTEHQGTLIVDMFTYVQATEKLSIEKYQAISACLLACDQEPHLTFLGPYLASLVGFFFFFSAAVLAMDKYLHSLLTSNAGVLAVLHLGSFGL